MKAIRNSSSMTRFDTNHQEFLLIYFSQYMHEECSYFLLSIAKNSECLLRYLSRKVAQLQPAPSYMFMEMRFQHTIMGNFLYTNTIFLFLRLLKITNVFSDCPQERLKSNLLRLNIPDLMQIEFFRKNDSNKLFVP